MQEDADRGQRRTPGPNGPTGEAGAAARVWQAVGDLFTNEVYVLASAIAFNALLSFFPVMLLTLSFCRNVLKSRPAYDAVLEVTRDYLPTGQAFIIRNIQLVVASFGKGEVLSVILLLFTSSGILIPIQIALNRAWGAPAKPRNMKSQLFKDFKDQALAFLIIVVCGLMGLASSSLVVLLRQIIPSAVHSARGVDLLGAVVVKALAMALTFAVFFTLYFALPDRRITARQAWPAALFAGLAWEATRVVCFRWVFPWLNFKEAYGPFYISVTLVMWAFVSAMILVLGANLSAQHLLPASNRRKAQEVS